MPTSVPAHWQRSSEINITVLATLRETKGNGKHVISPRELKQCQGGLKNASHCFYYLEDLKGHRSALRDARALERPSQDGLFAHLLGTSKYLLLSSN